METSDKGELEAFGSWGPHAAQAQAGTHEWPAPLTCMDLETSTSAVEVRMCHGWEMAGLEAAFRRIQ